MALIQSGVSADLLTVDPTSKAARVTLYDAFGSVIAPRDRAALALGTASGMMLLGAEHKTARLVRVSPGGTVRTSAESLFFADHAEGAAVNTQAWVQTTTTMTITQAAGVITFNAGASAVTTVGAMHTTHRQFPLYERAGLVGRFRVRATAHFGGNSHEIGFGAPATATTHIASGVGAFWRKDTTGQWLPVISYASGVEKLGTVISDATWIAAIPASSFFTLEVDIQAGRVRFSAYTGDNNLAFEQELDYDASADGFRGTHVQGLVRTYNNSATGTAVQLLLNSAVVLATDSATAPRIWGDALAGIGYSALTSPTAYTQLANYVNSAAPASATLSNTAAGYTTLGGQFQFAAVAGAETDYALFGFAVPAPYTLYVKKIRISLWNMVVAVATTPTTCSWAAAGNSSAVSLATAGVYPPMRYALGSQVLPIGTVAGGNAPDLVEDLGDNPIVVQPGRFFHIILKMPVATATATEIIRGMVAVGGYFE